MSGKIITPTPASKGVTIARYVLVSIVAIFAMIAKAVANRRAVVRLSDLDDHLLRDIGVTREDVRWSLDTPVHVDPSHRLALRRLQGKAERRAGPWRVAPRPLRLDEIFAIARREATLAAA